MFKQSWFSWRINTSFFPFNQCFCCFYFIYCRIKLQNISYQTPNLVFFFLFAHHIKYMLWIYWFSQNTEEEKKIIRSCTKFLWKKKIVEKTLKSREHVLKWITNWTFTKMWKSLEKKSMFKREQDVIVLSLKFWLSGIYQEFMIVKICGKTLKKT